MTPTPTPTPEAQLIENARKKLSLTIISAATQAGISESRWRQLAKGYVAIKKGVTIPAIPPADTLAAMALAVGVTPTQLREVGRNDAATILTTRSHTPLQRSIEDIPTTELITEIEHLMHELGRRATNPHQETTPEFPPLRRVARRVDPTDHTTFGGPE